MALNLCLCSGCKELHWIKKGRRLTYAFWNFLD